MTLRGYIFLVFTLLNYSVFAQCVVNVNFNTWSQAGNPANGNWSVQGGGTQIFQIINGNETYYISPTDFINVEITGEFRSTDNDDDWMGFVFGFRDPLGANYNTYDMLLFDWKQDNQGCNPIGMCLAKVTGTLTGALPGNSFGCHINSPEFNILASNFAPPGWVRNQWHQFRLIYTFSRIIIYVDNVLRFDVTGCFEPGRFGFYNRSQSDCYYRNFNYRLNVDFAIASTVFCPNVPVDFRFLDNTCAPNYNFTLVQSMVWDFGDGNQFVNNNPSYANVNSSHAYANPGTYNVTLTFTDNLGCVSSETKPITINPSPTAAFTVDVGCVNNPVSLTNLSSGAVAITDGVWNMDDGNTVNGVNPGGYSYTVAGNYNVQLTVTDANGCTASATQPTNIINSIDATFVVADANCPAVNDGSVSVLSIDNGTSPYSYNWSNTSVNQNIQNLIPGNYTITITDANGCTGSHTRTVAISNATQLSYSFSTSDYNGYDVSCNGFSDGFADMTLNNGNAPYNYLWSNGTTSSLTQNISAGNYNVTVTDANNCSAVASVTISEPAVITPLLNVTSNYNGQHISCFGASDGAVSATTGGGASPYTYLWNNNQNTSGINNLPAGNYSVTVTDNNGCTATDNITVTEPAAVSLSFAPSDYNGYGVSCFNSQNGFINSSVAGGTPGYIYSWNNGQSNADASNLSVGNYSLTVYDANNCSATANASLSEPTALEATLSFVEPSCFGYDDGNMIASALGGVPSYSYLWSNGTNAVVNNSLSAGNYSLTVTDANGCSVIVSEQLNEPAPVAVTIEPVDDTIPFFGSQMKINSSYTANGNNAVSFLWEPSETLINAFVQNPVAQPLHTTTYKLTVTDEDGCVGTEEVTVYVSNDKVVYVPNVFSPNGDGVNDVFKIYTYDEGVKQTTFRIHDRWGQLVFETADIAAGWNGTLNGKELSNDLYVYSVYIIYLDGDSYKQKGSVTLLR
jgi:gliding motility-associated-like protein